jgi:hypothetical protein
LAAADDLSRTLLEHLLARREPLDVMPLAGLTA